MNNESFYRNSIFLVTYRITSGLSWLIVLDPYIYETCKVFVENTSTNNEQTFLYTNM